MQMNTYVHIFLSVLFKLVLGILLYYYHDDYNQIASQFPRERERDCANLPHRGPETAETALRICLP